MNEANMGKPIEILLVEDNPGDVDLTREGLKDGKVLNNLSVVTNGEEALAYLRREGKHATAVLPDLVLLDLNIPKKDGRQVLKEIRADPNLHHLPVVVLTSSQAEEDILRSYQLNANSYITKPVDLERFLQVVKAIENFWFTVVTLPPRR